MIVNTDKNKPRRKEHRYGNNPARRKLTFAQGRAKSSKRKLSDLSPASSLFEKSMFTMR